MTKPLNISKYLKTNDDIIAYLQAGLEDKEVLEIVVKNCIEALTPPKNFEELKEWAFNKFNYCIDIEKNGFDNWLEIHKAAENKNYNIGTQKFYKKGNKVFIEVFSNNYGIKGNFSILQTYLIIKLIRSK